MPILRLGLEMARYGLHSYSTGKHSITHLHLTACEDRKYNLGEKTPLKQKESIFWWTTDSFSYFDPKRSLNAH